MTDEITKWEEADYDRAARALVEQERKLARNSGSKGSGDFLKHFGPYKAWTDEEWTQAKIGGGINTAIGIARRDAHCALNAIPRVPEGYKLVRVQ